VLPDVPDATLLDELSVVVSSGWDLPSRPNRRQQIRHLLLMVDPADSQSYGQAAQRLLEMIDDALREADDDRLGADDRTGCRILLGVLPTYRSVASPTRRRREAADFLIPEWEANPPSDPAGTFQRRHQRNALRQVLECLRQRYGEDAGTDAYYDVVRIQRWYVVTPDRQVSEQGEIGEYRIRRDGFDCMELRESKHDPEGLESSEFEVLRLGDDPPPVLETVEDSETQPDYRRITLRLPQSYEAGDILRVGWTERFIFGPEPPDWWRSWVTAAALNDHFELEMSVTFTDDAQLPDLCWWFSAEPITDLNEIGPDSLEHLIDLQQSGTASHDWRPTETERRRMYGLTWVWLDDPAARERWEAARVRLERAQLGSP